MLKIHVAQINPTVGDLPGNLRLMTEAAQAARTAGARFVVFPELSLTGYYPGDLLDDDRFIERAQAVFGELLQASRQMPSLYWVVGLPVRRTGPGKRLHNALRVVCDGEVVAEYAKQELPNYQVFDEKRYFLAGSEPCVVDIDGVPVAITICEDIWHAGPMRQAAAAGARLMLNLNASPFHVGKQQLLAPVEHRLHHDIQAQAIQGFAQAIRNCANVVVAAKADVGGHALEQPVGVFG